MVARDNFTSPLRCLLKGALVPECCPFEVIEVWALLSL